MMKIRRYSKNADGKWECEETDEPEPVGDPWYDRVKALAEANPGRVAMGTKYEKDGQIQVENAELIDGL